MPGRQNAQEWFTDRGSSFFATGVGGPLTGRGARVLVIDDPIKNREEAESPTIRQKIWDWFTSTAYTRVEPGGSTIVVHTRWHADDLIGRIERGDAGEGWEIINIPAINSEDQVLWPELRPRDYLDEVRRVVGEYDWSALYLGQPRPKGAALFAGSAGRYKFHDPDEGWIYLVVVDPAATEKTSADYSVVMVVALKGKPGTLSHRMQVLDIKRGQWRTPVLARTILETCQEWGAPAVVEEVGGFKAVPQMLRDLDRRLRILGVTPSQDKFIRATPVAAAWSDGRVELPEKAPWLKPLLNETGLFTGVKDARDDQVDCLAHGWNAYAAVQQIERGLYVPGWREII
jgi:predicted phage terminase large subunit-like protein